MTDDSLMGLSDDLVSITANLEDFIQRLEMNLGLADSALPAGVDRTLLDRVRNLVSAAVIITDEARGLFDALLGRKQELVIIEEGP